MTAEDSGIWSEIHPEPMVFRVSLHGIRIDAGARTELVTLCETLGGLPTSRTMTSPLAWRSARRTVHILERCAGVSGESSGTLHSASNLHMRRMSCTTH